MKRIFHEFFKILDFQNFIFSITFSLQNILQFFKVIYFSVCKMIADMHICFETGCMLLQIFAMSGEIFGRFCQKISGYVRGCKNVQKFSFYAFLQILSLKKSPKNLPPDTIFLGRIRIGLKFNPNKKSFKNISYINF